MDADADLRAMGLILEDMCAIDIDTLDLAAAAESHADMRVRGDPRGTSVTHAV